jgi:hypothetical protein
MGGTGNGEKSLRGVALSTVCQQNIKQFSCGFEGAFFERRLKVACEVFPRDWLDLEESRGLVEGGKTVSISMRRVGTRDIAYACQSSSVTQLIWISSKP